MSHLTADFASLAKDLADLQVEAERMADRAKAIADRFDAIARQERDRHQHGAPGQGGHQHG